MDKKKILESLKEKNEVMEILPGEYLGFFKRIGDNKSVAKVMDLKPDYFIKYFDNSIDCVFFIKSAFEAFSHLSKMAVLKMLNCELDFKSAIFYAPDSAVFQSEERGVFLEKKSVNAADSFGKIRFLLDDFEKKIGKKIILNIEVVKGGD